MAKISHLQLAMCGKSRCIASVACWHDTIKHIDSPGDPLNQVDRPTDTHQIAWLIRRQSRTDHVQDPVHFRRWLAYAQTADRIPIKSDLDQLLSTSDSQVWIETTLNNSEFGLIVSFCGILATLSPSNASIARILNRLVRCWQRDNVVQNHRDVTAEFLLDAD